MPNSLRCIQHDLILTCKRSRMFINTNCLYECLQILKKYVFYPNITLLIKQLNVIENYTANEDKITTF